jgi:hypothetical protein
VRDDLIDRVIEAKLRRVATIDPASCSVSEWDSATHLDVMSMHDTMNYTARPDGAICLERQPDDRLPAVVAPSNHGDATGELAPSDAATLRDPSAVPSMRPERLRTIGRAYQIAFDAWGPDDAAFNRPYLGGYETRTLGPKLPDPRTARGGPPTRRHHPPPPASASGRTSASASSSSRPKQRPSWRSQGPIAPAT